MFVMSKTKDGIATWVFLTSGGPALLLLLFRNGIACVTPQACRLIVLCVEQLHTGPCIGRGNVLCLLALNLERYPSVHVFISGTKSVWESLF